MPTHLPRVEASNLSLRRGNLDVLRAVSLGFSCGVYGLQGPNGAGKSSLLQVLAGILQPGSGQVIVTDKDGQATPLSRSVQPIMGYMPQSAAIPGHLRTRDAVRYAAWLKCVPANQIDVLVSRALRLADLAEFQDARIRKLSGGTHQRVLFAQSIVNRPQVLLLDEPVASLDSNQREQFYRQVTSLKADTAILMSSHLNNELESVADVIYSLDGGTLN